MPVPHLALKSAVLLLLALLAGAAALMLYHMPVQRYAVACERAASVGCDLEQSTAAATRRWHVPLGDDPAAVVRILPRRRGGDRVLLYLRWRAGSVFAAEFEGGDAESAADAAAARLNAVLRGSGPAVASIAVAPPPYLHWLAWGMLGVMLLLVGAVWRGTPRRATGR